MSDAAMHIWRRILLCFAVIVAVGAFFPDMSHLDAKDVSQDVAAGDHDHNGTSEKDTGHCHTGASCTGAMNVRHFLIATNIGLPITQLLYEVVVDRDSHVLGSDPPIPILSV